MKKDIITHPFRKFDVFILSFLLILAFAFRMYKVNTPLADFHSWRQADTAAVARNFVRHGINLFDPRYDDFSSVETGIENPKGYRFVEFPLYNGVIAVFAKFIPMWPVEVWGRITTALFSLFLISIIYYIGLKESSRVTAVVAALVYAVFPFFVFFSRVILPETAALTFAFLSIYFLYKRNFSSTRLTTFYFILSLISFATALLIKPPTAFFAITLLTLMIEYDRLKIVKTVRNYLFFFLSLIPFVGWRYFISFHPEGIPASGWLITSVNTYQGLQNIFFRPAFFRWIFFERINIDILGGYLLPFLVIGSLSRMRNYLVPSILISSLAYLFTFQGGNVQHEYYQTMILPACALMIGIGVHTIVHNSKIFLNRYITYPLIIALFAFAYFVSYYKVKDFYYYPPEFTGMAQVVGFLTQPNDKIVTDRSGDTTLLYVIDRKGSPALYKELDAFKKDGYSFFLSTNKEKTEEIKKNKQYRIVFEGDKFALFRL